VKRGYLWLDWAELGCRGWDIDLSGAGLDADDNTERCHVDCFAHLDRTTLQLALHGCRAFVCRVINDLSWAGLYYIKRPVEPVTSGATTETITANAAAPASIKWIFNAAADWQAA
jgi:hypothetical protein